MTERRNLEICQTLAGVGAHDADLGQGGARSFKQKAPKPSGNQAVGNETTVASSPSQRYDIFFDYLCLSFCCRFIQAVSQVKEG